MEQPWCKRVYLTESNTILLYFILHTAYSSVGDDALLGHTLNIRGLIRLTFYEVKSELKQPYNNKLLHAFKSVENIKTWWEALHWEEQQL